MISDEEKTGRKGRSFLNAALHKNRREALRCVGIGLLGSLAAAQVEGAQVRRRKFKVLDENDKLDIGDKGKNIIEMAYKIGFELQKKHGGCTRCIVAALQGSTDFVGKNKALFRAASCLDGGATPKGLQSCGAFTGAGMIIGWVCGKNKFEKTGLSHKLIRKVYQKFEDEYGSVLCRDVKDKAQRNCPEVVGRAALWTAEVLLRQFTNYE